MKAEIPIYVIESALRHFEVVLENAMPKDTRASTANSFRLGRKDLAKLRRIVDNQKAKNK